MRFSDLDWRRRFLDELPADPRRDNTPRQVRGAAYSHVEATPVSAPRLLAWVDEVAALLGLEPHEEAAQVLSGNRTVPGMSPYSACYGGHQFGSWAGQLGDGRAITLGEILSASGARWELQLKGAGRTPYSRTADGRAVLRSSLRELVASEAMFHLGVPTTRALALVATGEPVTRDILYDGHPAPEPGAIVSRVAPSFLRFGSFEIFAARGEHELLRRLFEHTSRAYFDGASPAELLARVCRSTALMIAEWMRVGFVHGVMNTDNMSILGLTIDYGPYGFLEPFDPDWTPNTTDAGGRRYRFANQPAVAEWNLVKLAQALAPLVPDPSALEAALDVYADTYGRAQHAMLLGKLGLTVDDARFEDDERLCRDLLRLLSGEHEIDMTLFYRRLAALPLDAPHPLEALGPAYYSVERVTAEHRAALEAWLRRYAERARSEALRDDARAARMNAKNPLYIPRNYLLFETIAQVERGELDRLQELLDVLRRPYEERPGLERFAAKRPAWAENQPGSSMLSCSS